MFITVRGAKVEIAVSDGGMFHDVATKTYSATTLKGLTKKMREASIPKGGVIVEDIYTAKKGMVTGRVSTKGWRKSQFNVKWDDGTTAIIASYAVRRVTTPEEREKMGQLEAEQSALYQKLEESRAKISSYQIALSIHGELESTFPL